MNLTLPTGDIDLLAIGEVVVDFISEENVPSLHEATTFRRYQGGSPANIAANLARLGDRSAIVAKTGAGAFGHFCRAELERVGVITDYLVMDPQIRTTVVFVSRTTGTPDFEAFRAGDVALRPEEVPQEAIERSRVIHASTFALSRRPCRYAVLHAFKLASRLGKLISLDPNYSPRIWPDRAEALTVLKELFGMTTITKPSLDDAGRLFGPDKAPEWYIERFHELGPRLVILTMGNRGVIVSQEGDRTHLPALPVQVVDATGAGDAFWAGYLVSLLDGHDPVFAAHVGQALVAQKLSHVGPLPCRLDRHVLYQQASVSMAASAKA